MEAKMATPPSIPASGQITSGGSVTVTINPTNIEMYCLTEDQLETVASVNVVTAVSLAFLGICFGAWLTVYVTLASVNGLQDLTKATFVALQWGSGCLTIFFLVVFVVGLIKSVLGLRKIKRTGKAKVVAGQ